MDYFEKVERLMLWLVKKKVDEYWFKWMGWCLLTGTLAALASKNASIFLWLCATFSGLLIYFSIYNKIFNDGNIDYLKNEFSNIFNKPIKIFSIILVCLLPGFTMATIYYVVISILHTTNQRGQTMSTL